MCLPGSDQGKHSRGRTAIGTPSIPLGEAASLAALPGGPLLWAGLGALAALAAAFRSGARPRDLILGGLIGLLAPVAWVGTGFVLHDPFDPIGMESLSFTAPGAETLFWVVAASSIPAEPVRPRSGCTPARSRSRVAGGRRVPSSSR